MSPSGVGMEMPVAAVCLWLHVFVSLLWHGLYWDYSHTASAALELNFESIPSQQICLQLTCDRKQFKLVWKCELKCWYNILASEEVVYSVTSTSSVLQTPHVGHSCRPAQEAKIKAYSNTRYKSFYHQNLGGCWQCIGLWVIFPYILCPLLQPESRGHLCAFVSSPNRSGPLMTWTL